MFNNGPKDAASRTDQPPVSQNDGAEVLNFPVTSPRASHDTISFLDRVYQRAGQTPQFTDVESFLLPFNTEIAQVQEARRAQQAQEPVEVIPPSRADVARAFVAEIFASLVSSIGFRKAG